jgi:2-oxoglutarate ferredoxin oxidoreductase subunit alpha
LHKFLKGGAGNDPITRTEQGDLELALYAGHGEFPSIILAPSRCRVLLI